MPTHKPIITAIGPYIPIGTIPVTPPIHVHIKPLTNQAHHGIMLCHLEEDLLIVR
jgi:hypothetical protein